MSTQKEKIEKIMLIGSMKFAKEMVELQKQLEGMGLTVSIPIGTDSHLNGTQFVDNLQDNLTWCIENDIMRRNFDHQVEHDAVLVVNYPRNNIDGYIGISTLMEMGVAHFLRKKIFLLHDFPSFDEHRWAQEVAIMQPIILKGNIESIKDHL